MNRAETALTVAGGATGWLATLTLTDGAQVLAGLATAVWMGAQTYVLIRRQRCTRRDCARRIVK